MRFVERDSADYQGLFWALTHKAVNVASSRWCSSTHCSDNDDDDYDDISWDNPCTLSALRQRMWRRSTTEHLTCAFIANSAAATRGVVMRILATFPRFNEASYTTAQQWHAYRTMLSVIAVYRISSYKVCIAARCRVLLTEQWHSAPTFWACDCVFSDLSLSCVACQLW